jgi:zinc transport system permease protein
MDDFMIRALLAGIGVAIVSGPLGAFVVWRRMAFFGDTLSHSALLGVALGFLFGINLNIGVFIICIVIAVLLVRMSQFKNLSNDTLLGILSHSSLALGLITISFLDNQRIDLMALLFGDVLATTVSDLVLIYLVGISILVVLIGLWKPLLSLTVDEEMAVVEGVSVKSVNLLFMLLLAVIVALAMKVVGILLVTSLIIIPAASASRFSNSPEQMVFLATLGGCISVMVGLWGSLHFDTPSGPSIVAAAFIMFVVSSFFPNFRLR